MPRRMKGGYKPKAGGGAGRDQVVTATPTDPAPATQEEKDKQKKGKNPPLTHFLCLPLINSSSKSQIEDSLQQFKKEVTAAGSSPQVPEKAIRPLGTIHLTLGVMSLNETARVDSAISFLKELDIGAMLREAATSSTSANPPLTENAETSAQDAAGKKETVGNDSVPGGASRLQFSLRSLASMTSPKKTSVLYAVPEGSNHLQPFTEDLRKKFTDAGFLIPENRALKLHATIINTIYAKGGRRGNPRKAKPAAQTEVKSEEPLDSTKPKDDQAVEDHIEPIKPDGSDLSDIDASTQPTASTQPQADDGSSGHGPNAKAFIRFDATALLEKYKDYTWAKDMRIEKVAICKMGAKKIVNENGRVVDERYEEVASVGLPG